MNETPTTSHRVHAGCGHMCPPCGAKALLTRWRRKDRVCTHPLFCTHCSWCGVPQRRVRRLVSALGGVAVFLALQFWLNPPKDRVVVEATPPSVQQYWSDNTPQLKFAGTITGNPQPPDTAAFLIVDSTEEGGTLMRLDHTGRIDTKHSGTVRTREPRLFGHLARVAVHKDAVCVCASVEDRVVSCAVRGGALEVLAEGPPVDVRYVCF